jgi:glycosyltransferase involved in cell wall biosynthesis
MAAGKAIVASNVGEVPRMLGRSGFLAEPGDSESLAAGMIRYIEDTVLRKRHGREVRKRAESTYNWERTTDNIEKAYLMAVSER